MIENLSWNKIIRYTIYTAGYAILAILLDLASGFFVLQTGLAICYPPAGLYMAAILLLGWKALPLAFINPVFSVLVTLHDPSIPMTAVVGIGAVSMISPAISLWAIKRTPWKSATLHTFTQVSTFLAVVLLATIIESLASAGVYVASGLSNPGNYWSVAAAWYISNIIPYMTVTPFILLMARPVRIRKMVWIGPNGLLALLIALLSPFLVAVSFISIQTSDTNRLYLALFPVIVGSLGGGLYGASWASLWVTASVLTLAPLYLHNTYMVLEAQFFLFAANLTGLITGAVVTDRRTAERALADSEERFRLLAENSSDLVIELSPDFKILYASPSSLGMFGYQPEELHDHTPLEFCHPDDQPDIMQMQKVLLESSEPHTITYRSRCKDGSYLWAEATSRAIFDSKTGKLSAVHASVRNITRRKLAEEQVRQLNAELEQRVAERTAELEGKTRELQTFAYSITHDLKTPLRGINGYSYLLESGYAELLDEEGRVFLHNIRTGTQRMHQVITDLMVYAELEKRPLVLETVNLPAMVETLLFSRQEEIKQREANVQVKLSCREIRADKLGLEQTLHCLLDNALKFTSAQPNIEIGCATRLAGEVANNVSPEVYDQAMENTCILWVKDNGIGFNMQYHDRIFELFQRLNRIEDYPGTGIGLALVQKVVQRMGGRIWAKSIPGKGSEFYIEIPQ